MDSMKNLCAFCHYSRMRTEICGIYCTGGFTNDDGDCDKFIDYTDAKDRQSNEEGKR